MKKIRRINSNSLDGTIEGIIRRAEMFSNVKIDWLDRSLLAKAFNGGMIRWNDKMLLSWRLGKGVTSMQFVWHSEESLLVDKYVFDKEKGEDMYRVPPTANWSLGSQDGRLHPHPNPNKKYLTYVFYTRKYYGISFAALTEITLDNSTIGDLPKLNFSDPIVLHIEGKFATSQKNWTPFLYKNELYYVTNIYPFRIVQMKPNRTEGNNVFLAYLEESHIPEINQSAIIAAKHTYHPHTLQTQEIHLHPTHHHPHHHNVSHATPPCKIPWDPLYGTHIRGGTPAIRVSGNRYLSFFHAVREIWGMNTYFIGAFTFSGSRPFRLLEMSRYPIQQYFFYDGKWLNKYVSYVLFPISVMYDKKDRSYIWLSFGHQDGKTYIQKFRLDQILDSLEPTIHC